MGWTTLDKPLLVTGEITGRFRASPGFRLSGGDLGEGRTALGLLTVPPGVWGAEMDGVELDLSAIPPTAPEWQQNQVRGIHVSLADDTKVTNARILNAPREAIYAHGARGLHIEGSKDEGCESFANFDYQTGSVRRANSGVFVTHCQHENGSSYGVAPTGDPFESVLRPGRWIGGNGINGYLIDSEISHFDCVGEYKGCVKLSASERVRVAYCSGSSFMFQGSVYWNVVDGPHEINGPHGRLLMPTRPNFESYRLTLEGCTARPSLSLWRRVDDPLGGGNTLQLSWPQQETRILDNHFWWELGPPSQPSLFACIQLANTGHEVEVRDNVFHGVKSASDPHAIHLGDHPQDPTQDPSSLNPDWAVANRFVPV